jgi:hypothetical protein
LEHSNFSEIFIREPFSQKREIFPLSVQSDLDI